MTIGSLYLDSIRAPCSVSLCIFRMPFTSLSIPCGVIVCCSGHKTGEALGIPETGSPLKARSDQFSMDLQNEAL